jgi:hypothetical protein
MISLGFQSDLRENYPQAVNKVKLGCVCIGLESLVEE